LLFEWLFSKDGQDVLLENMRSAYWGVSSNWPPLRRMKEP
jgi:hypothetical protein